MNDPGVESFISGSEWMNRGFDDHLDFSTDPERIQRTLQYISRNRPSALPDCMRRLRFDCTGCELVHPSRCLIASDPDFASYLRYQVDRDVQLRNVIRKVIREHGRPLYWDIVVAMVQSRAPHLSRQVIYSVLSSCSADFTAVEHGVYGLAEWG